MAKAAKKKQKPAKKSARVAAKPKAAAKSAKAVKKAAKPAKTAAKKKTTKIDPLNRKNYGALTPMLAVRDVRRAMNFYNTAFGFKTKGAMEGPGGILVHAELTLRETTLMLSPEEPRQNALSASAIGNTPVTLYVLVEDVDKVFANAVAAGGKVVMELNDAFWGDRVGMLTDPDGNKWMIATHKSEPTEAEMAEVMQKMQQSEHASAAAAGAGSDREF